MVAVQSKRQRSRLDPVQLLLLVLFGLAMVYIAGMAFLLAGSSSESNNNKDKNTISHDRQLRSERVDRPNRPQSVQVVFDETKWQKKLGPESACSYRSLSDLTSSELHPRKGKRHITNPPEGGKMTLVCCDTTAGPLNIVAHHSWAPNGAERAVEMVKSGYFDSGVPLMRCVKGFLCQFGLNSDVNKSKEFRSSIPDDPQWLPAGPKHREFRGVKRFAQGYLAYAGSGPNSRSKQWIMTLEGNGPLGGGSPWEVPWGELVHPESYATLKNIFTGYGEKGPPQGKLGSQGTTEDMKKEFPKLDYIKSCRLIDETTFPESSPDAHHLD